MIAPSPAKLAPGRFLTLTQVELETSLNRATIYRRIAHGTFPRQHPLGGGRVVWLERDIEAWKNHIIAEPPS